MFEHLKYLQIKALLEVVNDAKEKNLEIIMNRHKSISDNFNGANEFLQELKVLKEKNGRVSIKKEFEIAINERLSDSELKRLLLDKLLTTKSVLSHGILSYLHKFKVVQNTFEYKPNTASRVKESEVRNLLIDLDLIEYNRSSGIYRINERYFDSFKAFLSSKKLSPREFELILKRQDDLGKGAELEVLRYEKERLTKYPVLIAKIEHTAKKDVLAGYDILSWETDCRFSKAVPRYIEVKAVSNSDRNFYWTRNELATAEKLGDRYYLYLLPVIGDRQFDVGAIEIIPNPVKNVFNNSSCWNRQVETYLFLQEH